VPNLGNYALVLALRAPGCPLCRVLADAEIQEMDAFIRERNVAAEAVGEFCERGGFCRDHAWLLHRRSALALTGAPVAQAYGALVKSDIARLEQLATALATGQRRRGLRHRSLLARRTCPACDRADRRLSTKAKAFAEALAEPEVRNAYSLSDGLCVQHIDTVGAAALANRDTAAYLIDDLHRRLETLEQRLDQYDRLRGGNLPGDQREADAWTDVVRSYVGE
jgi:Family of unknown function (DUF6062)